MNKRYLIQLSNSLPVCDVTDAQASLTKAKVS